jgi:light-regulated signal transduction histidine kinase (bacteriophytochrome)
MGQLIDDLLAFSRAGKQEIVMRAVDTGKMVKGIIDELIPGSNDTHRIEWTVHSLPAAYGDADMIRQVWVNLISNAIKYSGRQEPARIEIGHFPQDGQLAFFVKDNGVGFNNKYKDKLFRVFQRLHKAEEFEGTGVGLALVEKIVSKHGGRVWAEGEPGNGARFCFSLPEGR